jgi:hypothetical protein
LLSGETFGPAPHTAGISCFFSKSRHELFSDAPPFGIGFGDFVEIA